MAESLCAAEEWLAENHQGMISCPYQPGGLMISKNACMKRHRAARTERIEEPIKDEIFLYNLNKGFSVCRACRIGERLTARAVKYPQVPELFVKRRIFTRQEEL